MLIAINIAINCNRSISIVAFETLRIVMNGQIYSSVYKTTFHTINAFVPQLGIVSDRYEQRRLKIINKLIIDLLANSE